MNFEQIGQLLRGLTLTRDDQRKVRQVFESEMELGLARNPSKASSLQMENTFLPELCDGSGTKFFFKRLIGNFIKID